MKHTKQKWRMVSICVAFYLEWGSGYSAHFGMVHVNHSDPTLKRTPKKSALWYKDVIEQHGFESV